MKFLLNIVLAALLASCAYAKDGGAQIDVQLLNKPTDVIAPGGSKTYTYASLESSEHQALAVSVTSAGAVVVEIDVQVGYAHPVTKVVTYFDAENAQNIAVAGVAGTVKRAVGLSVPVSKILEITVRNNGASPVTVNLLYLANS